MAKKASVKRPLVSVIMGVYNQKSEAELNHAVDSILAQTLTDFEFIIYDDGSDPKFSEYIDAQKKKDKRIILIGASVNHGLAFSLNQCISTARGRFIARMDADDYCYPERLEVQVRFLQTHLAYDWCGCSADLFDSQGIWGRRYMPAVPTEKDYLRFSPFIHPTVVYRREVLTGERGYKVAPDTLRCEDYEIFMRLHRLGYIGCNLQTTLFAYREDRVSYGKRKFRFRINESKLRYRNFKEMGLLTPVGWLYVARPIIGGLVPDPVISLLKRKESGIKYGRAKRTARLRKTHRRSTAAKAGRLSAGTGGTPAKRRRPGKGSGRSAAKNHG